MNKKCNCKEMSCDKDCVRSHTHKGFFCETCRPDSYSKEEKCKCGAKIELGVPHHCNYLDGVPIEPINEPPQESWEEGFGNLLDRLGIFLEFDHKEIIMNCISNLLSSEKAQLIQEIIEKLPKEKNKEYAENDLKKAVTPNVIKLLSGQVGYNQALQEIKQIISKLKTK